MLTMANLATGLETHWLVGDGGVFPSSPLESADRFSAAVVDWFALAMAAAIPCTTAMARRQQLMSMAAPALAAGAGPAAGQQLAQAVAAYMTGQNFGAGVSLRPVATPAGATAFTTALLDMSIERRRRAELIAGGCHTMAVSTLVVFPTPLPPAPVL